MNALHFAVLADGFNKRIISFDRSFFCDYLFKRLFFLYAEMLRKLNTFWLTCSWKPLTNASVMIITATLIMVAAMESRMMNREKDRCWLNAIRFAIKPATLKLFCLSLLRTKIRVKTVYGLFCPNFTLFNAQLKNCR